MRNELYRLPKDWQGDTCVILGGGPSLPKALIPKLRDRVRVVAVNNAGLSLAPWADVLYFSDKQWHDWNASQLYKYRGPLVISRSPVDDSRVRLIGRSLRMALSHKPDILAGVCGGANSINLAFLRGAGTIILLGFDMRPGNWHNDHKKPPRPNCHALEFIPSLNRMAPELAQAGRRVINATPSSALTCFPVMSPDEALEGLV